LADRLVEQDHTADPFLRALRGEEKVAVRAAALFRRVDADRVEPALDRAAALVRRQDAPARCDECPCGLGQHALIIALPSAVHDATAGPVRQRARRASAAAGAPRRRAWPLA